MDSALIDDAAALSPRASRTSLRSRPQRPPLDERPGEPRDGLAELLEGADARARSPYGLPLPAPAGLVHFGSCTANPITPDLLARHAVLAQRQAWPDPAQSLRQRHGATQCVLAASGTDAEYTCAVAMGRRPFVSVLMDPAEIGSGCARAAAGLTHAALGPVQQSLALAATVRTVPWRDATGRPLRQAMVDEQVLALVQQHRHDALLLHHVPCSKTGLSAPSEATCREIQRLHPAEARVVVDASQGRCSDADVRRWLSYGWAVMLTGSKFLGAPPFCGATLLPPGWPIGRPFGGGEGLRARWRLALDAMDRNRAPENNATGATANGIDIVETAWRDAVAEGLLRPLAAQHTVRPDPAADGDTPSRQGITAFDLGLDAEGTLRLHRRLIHRGFFIGQPVAAGPQHLLRVARGVHTSPATAQVDLERLALAIRRELQHG